MTDYSAVTRRQARALIVGEFGRNGVSATDYLQHTSERDPARIQS